MIIITLIISLPVLFLSYVVFLQTKQRLNPASLLVYIWVILLLLAVSIGDDSGFYPMDVTGIFAVFTFLLVVLLVFYLTMRKTSTIEVEPTVIDQSYLMSVSVFLFFLCIFSNIMYLVQVSQYISIGSLLKNMWSWKHLVLTGVIKESGLLYIGRNLALTGAVLSINMYFNKGRLSTLMLIVFVILAFLNPRRDPIIIKLIYVIAPLLVLYKGNIKRILLLAIPVGILFFILSLTLTSQLSFGERTLGDTIGLYTYGSFNSLQKAIDFGYPQNTNLILGNTFYFIYMFLKYISPVFTPPEIILVSLGKDTTNVYTALIAPLIDANGSYFWFLFITILYGVFVGYVTGLFYKSYINHPNRVSSLILFCSCYSCIVRSFYNPSFSYSDYVFAVIYWMVFRLFEKGRFVKFTRKRIR